MRKLIKDYITKEFGLHEVKLHLVENGHYSLFVTYDHVVYIGIKPIHKIKKEQKSINIWDFLAFIYESKK